MHDLEHAKRPTATPQRPDEPAADSAGALDAQRTAHQRIYEVARAAIAQVSATDARQELERRRQRGGQ